MSTNLITGRSIRDLGGLVDAGRFGVVADGVKDNFSALQDALDACSDLNSVYSGAVLMLPPGKIMTSPGLIGRHGITMRGAGKGMKYAGYNPDPDIGGTWIESLNPSSTDFILAFHTKAPVDLADFSVVMAPGNSNPHGILIDNKDGDAGNTSIANFGSRIHNVGTMGGSVGLKLLNCANYDVGFNRIFDARNVSLWLENDGTGTPYPIIDNGDASVHNNHMHSFAESITNSTSILMRTQGGLQIGPNNKTLGMQYAYWYQAQIAGTTGEVTIHHNNNEAWAVNCLHISKEVTGAFVAGINMIGNHGNGGSGAPGAPPAQGYVSVATHADGNYFTRGKFFHNDVLYTAASAGTNAFNFAAGDQIVVAHNTFQIPSDAHILGTDADAGDIRAIHNGPVNGPTQVFSNCKSSTRIIDENGITVAQLGAWANGSMVYVTDAKRTSSSDPTVIGGGQGGWCYRNGGAWHTAQPN